MYDPNVALQDPGIVMLYLKAKPYKYNRGMQLISIPLDKITELQLVFLEKLY